MTLVRTRRTCRKPPGDVLRRQTDRVANICLLSPRQLLPSGRTICGGNMKYAVMAIMAVLVLTGCQTPDNGKYTDGPNDRHITSKVTGNLHQPAAPGSPFLR